MFRVIAISTVSFRRNCYRSKIDFSDGQQIVDSLREHIEPRILPGLSVIDQGISWIKIQNAEHEVTFSESDQTQEDQLCASVCSAWGLRYNYPDQYNKAIEEMDDSAAVKTLNDLDEGADFDAALNYLSSIRRKNRLYPPLKVVS